MHSENGALRKLAALIAISVCFLPSAFAGSDGFSAIHCGNDIAKALIGKKMSNERIVALEKRHQDLGLKDLGASEISQRLSCISWQICGSEFMLLQDGQLVRDVIQIPPHSKKTPEFVGTGEMKGQETKAIIVAILDNEAESGAPMLPAKVAWKIDEKNGKFVSLSTEGLRCPRDGIITLDRGL